MAAIWFKDSPGSVAGWRTLKSKGERLKVLQTYAIVHDRGSSERQPLSTVS